MKQLMQNKTTLRCFQCENPVNKVVFSIIIHGIRQHYSLPGIFTTSGKINKQSLQVMLFNH